MNIFDVTTWDEQEMEDAVKYLTNFPLVDDMPPEIGTLHETPGWVQKVALQYFKEQLDGTANNAVKSRPFRVSDGREVDVFFLAVKRKYEAGKFDCVQRIDWLEGSEDDELRQRFGLLSVIPRWVAQAAALQIRQMHTNLKGQQRQMPEAVRQALRCNRVQKSLNALFEKIQQTNPTEKQRDHLLGYQEECESIVEYYEEQLLMDPRVRENDLEDSQLFEKVDIFKSYQVSIQQHLEAKR